MTTSDASLSRMTNSAVSKMLSRYKLENLERVVVRNMFGRAGVHKAFVDSLKEKKNLSGLVLKTNLHPTVCKELVDLLEHPASNIRSFDVMIQLF